MRFDSGASGTIVNLEAYEKQGYRLYEDLAATVASILDAAIRVLPELKLQQVQRRAKDPVSLRAKLLARGAVEAPELEAVVKDLAGCRLIFYSNSDVSRFIQSDIMRANFEVDWDRTRLHFPGAEVASPDSQFIANNYVVRLKADRAALPEYAPVAGLWCEVQVQTILNHAWSAMAHDTIYKRPSLDGIGLAQMERIDKRMTKIMREYLLPAGYEFQKVLNDFERLASGQRLANTDVLEAIASASNNNERIELLERFENEVLPLYDRIQEVYPDIRASLLRGVAAAHQVAAQPIETPFGNMEGKSSSDVVAKVAGILDDLRYADLEATFDALGELFLGSQNDVERKRVRESAGRLAKHELSAWREAGPVVQVRLVDKIAGLEPPLSAALRPLITEVYGQVLSPEITGTFSTSSTVTWSTGCVVQSEALQSVRAKAMAGLEAQYIEAIDDDTKRDIIAALKEATRTPTQGRYGDEFLLQVLEDTLRLVDFLNKHATSQSYVIKQQCEHDLLFFLRRSRGIGKRGDPNQALAAAGDALSAGILRYRDTLNGSREYVVFKTLVGFNSVFPPDWDADSWDFRASEAYREERIREFVAELTQENADEWLAIVKACAAVRSEDLATFPIFGKFLRLVAKEKPSIAQVWLSHATEAPLSRFLPGMLSGLSESLPAATRAFVENALTTRVQINEVAHYLRHAEPVDGGLLERTLAVSQDIGDLGGVGSCLEASVARTSDLGVEVARRVFVSALSHLDAVGNTNWAHVASMWWQRSGLFSALSDDELVLVLAGLLKLPRLEYQAEEMLRAIASRLPNEVLDYFGRRLKRELETDRDGSLDGNYEALPFEFFSLDGQSFSSARIVVEKAWEWSSADPIMARFRGANFVAQMFPNWSSSLEEVLGEYVRSGDAGKQIFVLGILEHYNGNAFIHPIMRDLIEVLPDDSKLFGQARIALLSTGVVSGEFGHVEAYRFKREQMQEWLEDSRVQVRRFAEGVIHGLDLDIAAERRRAEEDIAMRRLEYGESPFPPAPSSEDGESTN